MEQREMRVTSRHEYPYPAGIWIDPDGVVMEGEALYGHIACIENFRILAAWRRFLES